MSKRVAHVLRCLGQPALMSANGEVIRIRTKKHLALLVYLAIESRRPHRRDDLAELLWPKAKIGEARHSLSTALSLFRAHLGRDAVEAGREKVAIRPGHLALDIARLLAGDTAGDEFTPPLEVAGFLEGFDIADAPDFMVWKDGQQARLLPAIKQALTTAIERCRRRGDFVQIETLAERMLALDDLSEDAIRAKMEARALAGDRVAALRVFEEWRGKLAGELGAEPSDALHSMAIKLRDSKWKRFDFAHRIDEVSAPLKRPFVGRQAEYQKLYQIWEQTQNNRPSHAFITGDSGVGKSTLVQRFADAIELEGAAVCKVKGFDIDREIPYATLSALIAELALNKNAVMTSPQALAELAPICPAINNRFPSTPPTNNRDGETTRTRIAEAFFDLLLAISDEQPILLVIDDFHFADDTSAVVLHLIIRKINRNPITIILVTRTADLCQSNQANRLLNNSTALGIVELEIKPLCNSESNALLTALISVDQSQPDKSTRRVLLNAAAGYPMVLELLVQDWQTHGDQTLALSLSAMTTDIKSDSEATTYQKLLHNIVAELPNSVQTILYLAAVLGRRLNELEMYRIVGLDPIETMSALATLTNKRLIRDNSRYLEFSNELIRSVVYVMIPTPVRAELHSKVADQLVDSASSRRNEYGLEIAWHCIRSGRQNEAMWHLLRGARDALDYGAPQSAEYALSTALSKLDGEGRIEGVVLLAEALQEQGRWRESLCHLASIPKDKSCDQSKLLTLQANHFLANSATSVTKSAVQELMEIAQRSPLPTIRVRAARVASRLLAELRDEQIANQLLQIIESMPLNQQEEQEAIELLTAKSRCLYHMHQRELSLIALETTIQRLQTAGSINSALCSLTMGRGAIKCQEGKYEEALTAFMNAHDISLHIGNDLLTDDAIAQVALCLCRLGRYEDLFRWTTANHLTDQLANIGYGKIQIAYYTALAYGLLNEKHHASNMLAEIENNPPDPKSFWLLQAWHFFRADILYITGKQKDATAVARRGLEHPDLRLHCRFFAGSFARWLALTSEYHGSLYAARNAIKELRGDFHRLDALDQAEALCAERVLCKKGIDNEPQSHIEQEIHMALNRLPHAVAHQLKILGML